MSCLLLFFFLFTLPFFKAAAYELVIIQNVSQSGRSFVLHKGKIDGILPGQEAMFTSPKFSFIAQAKEVSRYYSVWQMPNEYSTVPFHKHQYVTMSNNKDAIWQSVNTLSNQIDRIIDKKVAQDKFQVARDAFIIRATISRAVDESTSSTGANKTELRTGMQLEAFYENNFFRLIEVGIGLRYDEENAKIRDPALIIPTTRTLALLEFTYHFSPFTKSQKSFYGTIGGGVGRSNTTIASTTTQGVVTLLPYARIGLLMPMNKEVAFVAELAAEAISMKEYFEDNSTQDTNIINSKLSFGIRF
ncbi:MAG: hypothetical protein A2451_01080 [Bdellovibrionales bacterium RIFOXYC2_FULL_39_8]|nr:MAG: hypothetical protein A2451_01080 [Bdellovibrionales bacterium RIFOXYC2_FULL_39_8]